MPVDTSVILGYKPVELQNPLAAYGQIAQLQNAQNQNALAQYQLSSARRADESANALNAAYTKHFNPQTGEINQNALFGELASSGQGTQIPALQAKLMEAQKAKLGLTETQGKIDAAKVKQAHDSMEALGSTLAPFAAQIQSGKPVTYDEVLPAATRLVQMGVVKPEALGQLPQDPAQLSQVIMSLSTQTEASRKALMAYMPEALVAGGNVINKNPMAPGGIGAVQAPVAATQDTILRNAVTERGQNLSAETARRGQNMVDARSRERLAAETATGQLTPETKDFLAQTYVQTGQLPPMGMGKGAAQMRSEVLTRAAEIATGGGKTAEQAAADVRAGKADTAAVAKSVKDFATGTQGRQVNAFNTAIDHLDTMTKLSDALNNGDVKAINLIGNVIAKQTGRPAPTNFDAAKQIVTAEVIKAVVASGGGVTERQEAERNFATANSPDQLKGAIETYKQLLGGQLKSLNLQYENTTGRKDFAKKLTPAAQSELSRLRNESPAPAPAATGKWEIIK